MGKPRFDPMILHCLGDKRFVSVSVSVIIIIIISISIRRRGGEAVRL